MDKLFRKVPAIVITIIVVLAVLMAVFKFNLLGSQKIVTPAKSA